ncbi:MAG: response regulator transcription factor [Anaerolineales bacterium]|nr:response regulator transcription factor [Anaerolineales bacterium]
MTVGKIRILLADDEPENRLVIGRMLAAAGYDVLLALDGEEAVHLAASEQPDLILLDVMMPVKDGFTACREIRAFSTVPVMMLTARKEDDSKIRGLDLGADDYLTKPFNPDELLARVKAALRRIEMDRYPAQTPMIQAGQLRLDLDQQRVFIGDREIILGEVEFKILYELATHPGQMLTSEELAQAVWGADYPELGALRQAVFRLRNKLEPDTSRPMYIQSRSKRGYVFIP